MGYFVLVEFSQGADRIYEKLLGPQLSVIPEIVIFFFYEFVEVIPFDFLNHEVVVFLVFEVLIELENVRVVDLHAVDFKLVVEHHFGTRIHELLLVHTLDCHGSAIISAVEDLAEGAFAQLFG